MCLEDIRKSSIYGSYFGSLICYGEFPLHLPNLKIHLFQRMILNYNKFHSAWQLVMKNRFQNDLLFNTFTR